MGRRGLATGRQKRSAPMAPAVLAVITGAVFFAAAGSAGPFGARSADPTGDNGARCCMALVAAGPRVDRSGMQVIAVRADRASRSRVVSRFLPAGVAAERGLQVRTILAARSISEAFPQIHEIGGVRADALRWHPGGFALDVIIPSPGSAEGIALGDEIVAFALKNADRFGLQDAIWRGVYYTPGGPSGRGYGHYDHVHITTSGGGYPTGGENYLR